MHNDHPPTLATTALVVGAGAAVAGAGAGIYSATQTPGGVSTGQVPATGYQPYADPLLALYSHYGLLGAGQYSPQVAEQALPTQQLLAQALQIGQLNQRNYRLLQQAAGVDPEILRELEGITVATNGKKGGGPTAANRTISLLSSGGLFGTGGLFGGGGGTTAPIGTNDLRKAFLIKKGIDKKIATKIVRGFPELQRQATAQGYQSLGALFDAQVAARQQNAAQAEAYKPIAAAQQAAQLAQQQRLAGYIQNLPNLLTGEANPFVEQLRNEALVSAQKYGYNPYGGLQNAKTQALQQALQLISAEQAVGQNQLAPLAQGAALRQGAGATAAQLGGAQAGLLANALANQQAAETQRNAAMTQAFGNLGNTVGQFGLIGSSYAGGGGGV